jgi:CRP/FNR family transcriptional regulator, putaive post-exponential-phase nitrogen-starvation regulator
MKISIGRIFMSKKSIREDNLELYIKKFNIDSFLNYPLFLKFISKELVKKLNDSTSLRLGNLLPVKSRLAFFVVSKPDAANGNIIVFPEKGALASIPGTSYRHLNRILKELIEENIIGEGYPGVRIKNILKLKKLVDD